jgi:hypothetical protein
MFGSIDKSKGLLFVTYNLEQSIQNTQQKMRGEIEGMDGNRLLNTPATDLTAYFVEKYKIEPIALLKESWYADTEEVQVDVRHDPMRWIDDKRKPFLVAGERTEVRIPFEGESELFYSRSNTYNTNPPHAAIQGNELVLRYEMPSDAPKNVHPLVDQDLFTVLVFQVPK